MLHSLLVNDKKMAYVLGKTDMRIGVYEYNQQMKRCMKIKECGKSVNVAENHRVTVVHWINACVYVCRKKERTVKEK